MIDGEGLVNNRIIRASPSEFSPITALRVAEEFAAWRVAGAQPDRSARSTTVGVATKSVYRHGHLVQMQ